MGALQRLASLNHITECPWLLCQLLVARHSDMCWNLSESYPSSMASEFVKRSFGFNKNVLSRGPFMVPYCLGCSLIVCNIAHFPGVFVAVLMLSTIWSGSSSPLSSPGVFFT